MCAPAETLAADPARVASWRLHLGWRIGTLGASRNAPAAFFGMAGARFAVRERRAGPRW